MVRGREGCRYVNSISFFGHRSSAYKPASVKADEAIVNPFEDYVLVLRLISFMWDRFLAPTVLSTVTVLEKF